MGRSTSGFGRALAAVWTLILATAAFPGCDTTGSVSEGEEVSPVRPIAEVIAQHAPRWMEREDVVGVYEGATEDGSSCLKLMVTRITDELREAVPQSIEGYPVILVPTGPIGPRGD